MSVHGPRAGDRCGPWVLQAPVGAGGVAVVWRAVGDDGATAAVKLLDVQRAGPGEHRRFLREYEALFRIAHPNVVRVFGTGTCGGTPWIAMEYVDGADLDGVIAAWTQSPPADRFVRVEAIFRGICEGLRAVHAAGVVHRDLKPQNVLVGADGRPRITDFGIAREEDTSHVTQIGHLVGTIAYMAPELIAGEPADVRSDLYALGAVLYAMLTGRRPVEADSVAGYLARHLTEPPIPPTRWDAGVPLLLERIALRLLMKEPRQRFASAVDVLRALDGGDAVEPPLRGRDALAARWRAAIAALRTGRSALLEVVGPPGSGRSRVLRAIAEEAHADGLVRVDAPDAPAPADGPVVWLHEGGASLEASLDALRSGGRPFLAVVSLEAPAEILGDEPVEVLRLGPLGRDDVVTLLRDRGATPALAATVGARLQHECAGNPAAILAWVDALLAHRWIARDGVALVPLRPMHQLREAALPVPVGPADALWTVLRRLEVSEQRLVQLVAVYGRPTPMLCLSRAYQALAEDAGCDDPQRGVERLRRIGVLAVTDGEGDEDARADAEFEGCGLVLAAPGGAALVRAHLDSALLRALHRAIAAALGVGRRRRGGVAAFAAEHLLAAGDVESARPLLLVAARQAAREARPAQTLRLASRLLELPAAHLNPQDRAEVQVLAGDAHFLRGDWESARDCFSQARDASASVGAKARSGLGRALYRLGAWAEAERELHAALVLAEDGATRLGVLRPLADLAMQRLDLPCADALALEALRVARSVGSRDAEARARRGLAHVRGLQARFAEAREELERAEDLLDPDGDPNVRIGVCVRAMELDLAAGRWSVGLRRAALARDLLARFSLAEREPEASALEAALCLEVGEVARAGELARGALRRARALGPTGAPTALRALRVLISVDPAEVTIPEQASGADMYDPEGQRLALRARHASDADLARTALDRPPAAYRISHAQIVTDALTALALVSPTEARRRLAGLWPSFADDELLGLRWRLAALAVRVGEPEGERLERSLLRQLQAGLSVAHGRVLGA